MAIIQEDFSSSGVLTPAPSATWHIITSANEGIIRNWYIEDGYLKPQDAVSDAAGLVLYDNTYNTANGNMVVGYNGLDLYHGTDNLIVFRYRAYNDFTFISIQPGLDDARGVSVGFDTISQLEVGNIPLVNSAGGLLSDEPWGDRTRIPETGIVNFTYTNNTYDVTLYTETSAFLASGTYVDHDHLGVHDGRFGFAHTTKWNANIVGWDWVNISGSDLILSPPSIISLDSTDYNISPGDTVDISWSVYNGEVSATDVTLYDGYTNTNVGLTGTIPNTLSATTTYTLSAYNNLGSDSRSITVQVSDVVLDSSLSVYPVGVCSGVGYDVIWSTSGATSAFIDNGIGWVMSAGDTSGAIPQNNDSYTMYTISAYNAQGDVNIRIAEAYILNSTPIANAGPDISASSVDGPAYIEIDGSGSTDPQGQLLTYSWFLDGTSATGSGPLYTTNLSGGDYVVDMIVTNKCGNSAMDSVDVHVHEKHSPIADISINPPFLNIVPYTINISSSGSSDIDGTIVSYKWRVDGNLVNTTSAFDYNITSYGIHDISLEVTDNDGLIDNASEIFIATEIFSPSADAGPDYNSCIINNTYTTSAHLDGSNSLPSYDPSGLFNIVWYNWGLFEFGIPDVSGVVSGSDDIQIDLYNIPAGSRTASLTVSADTGLVDMDYVDVNVNVAPLISAYADITTLNHGETFTSTTLSGYSNVQNPVYDWEIAIDGEAPYNKSGQFPTINSLGVGHHIATLTVTDASTTCKSHQSTVDFSVHGATITIIDFSLTPDYVVGYPNILIPTTLYWSTDGATHVDIDNGIGNSLYKYGNRDLLLPEGVYSYTISAYNTSADLITKTITGVYDSAYNPDGTPKEIIICKEKEKYIKTYGADEIRYSKNRDINLVNYIPEYIRGTGTRELVEVFECYLNNMFEGERGYNLGENLLDLHECSMASCSTSAIDNTYNVGSSIINTPSYTPVGDVFINDICGIPNDDCGMGNDKISILDKIFRITDMFDPDLIPIELIQFYAQNLGYNVGISREAMAYSSTDVKSIEIEQRRYLRFMVRNLPTWYKLKTNRASVKIMLYSFGLVGSFVYYYTKSYCDSNGYALTRRDSLFNFNCIGDNTGPSTSGNTPGGSNDSCAINGDDRNLDYITPNELEKIKCCLYDSGDIYNSEEFSKVVDQVTKDDNKDWVLTRNDKTSVFEDISNPDITDDYFATPHFRLWIDILDSNSNYSADKHKQQMISESIRAIKPINTVFDGVSVYFGTKNTIYATSYMRLRKQYTFTS